MNLAIPSLFCLHANVVSFLPFVLFVLPFLSIVLSFLSIVLSFISPYIVLHDSDTIRTQFEHESNAIKRHEKNQHPLAGSHTSWTRFFIIFKPLHPSRIKFAPISYPLRPSRIKLTPISYPLRPSRIKNQYVWGVFSFLLARIKLEMHVRPSVVPEKSMSTMP